MNQPPAAQQATKSKPASRGWMGPAPKASEARALALLNIAAGFILCAVSIWYGFQGQLFMGRTLGGDFANFYVAGKILREYGGDRLYDFQLQYQLYRQAVPEAPEGLMLHFAHAPFLAALFAPLSLLSYRVAYCVWLVISYAIYAGGLLLLRPRLAAAGIERSQAWLLSLSFVPFVFETWIGGQVSVLSFGAFSLCFYLLNQERPLLAGAALGLCAFRPPLIGITGLMLLIGRRWRTAAGVVLSAAALFGAIGLAAGPGVFRGWLSALEFFRWAATGQKELFRVHKYLDWNAFFRLPLGSGSTVAALLALACTLAGLVLLARAWGRFSTLPRSSQDLVWAATLLATLICNVYVPVYDSLLVIVSLHLAASPASERGPAARASFERWLVPLYIVPWFTQSIAEVARVQILTLVLAGFGLWCLSEALAPARAVLDETPAEGTRGDASLAA